MTLALPLVALLAAQSNPDLEKANRYLFDQKYVEASKALEAAEKNKGNGRDMVMRIYELQGIVYGQLGQSVKSREAFQSLLALDPKRELQGKYAAKVTANFAAAKEWATANPPLDFKAAKAAMDDKGKVMQLAAKVKSDAMKLTKKVRFHLRADDANRWAEQDSEIQGAYAAANTDAAGVEWWAELLGENDRVLAVVASEAAPVKEGTVKDRGPAPDAPRKDSPPVVAKKDPDPAPPEEPKPAPVAESKPDATVGDESPGSSGSAARPVGYVLMATGLVAVGVGGAFGYLSGAARAQVTGAEKNPAGIVTGLTQKRAFELDATAKTDALIANVLYGVGAGVAVLGGVLWLVGGPSSDAKAALVPAPGGLVLTGSY